jgi:hypothetical protein
MAETEEDQYSETEIARRMERSLKRAFMRPHQPQSAQPIPPRTPKAKTRPASKGRVHKGKTGR